jgi:hypothetical protein
MVLMGAYSAVTMHVLVVMVVAGCGENGRQAVEGNVTLDGKPLQDGSIQFCPIEGTTGPTAGAEILNGHFSIAREEGLLPGTYRVEVNAMGKTQGKLPPALARQWGEYTQILPVRYNTESQLRAEVGARGPNHFDFTVASH